MTYQALARKWRPQDFSSIIGQDAVDDRAAQRDRRSPHRAGLSLLRHPRRRQDHGRAGPGEGAQLRAPPASRAGRRNAARRSLQRVRPLPRDHLRLRPRRDRDRRRHLLQGGAGARAHREPALRPRARRLQSGGDRRDPPPVAPGVRRAAQDRRGAAAAPGVHLRHHRDRGGAGHHPVALPGVPLPPRERGGARTSICADCATPRRSRPPTARCVCSRAPAKAAFATRWRCSTSSPPSAPVAVAEEDAVRLLGGLDLQLFHDLLRAILAGDAAAVTAALARVEDEGWDPRRTHDQFLAYCRDALARRGRHRSRAARPAGRGRRATGGAGQGRRLREPAAPAQPAAQERRAGAAQRDARPRGRDRVAARRRAAQADPHRGAPRRRVRGLGGRAGAEAATVAVRPRGGGSASERWTAVARWVAPIARRRDRAPTRASTAARERTRGESGPSRATRRPRRLRRQRRAAVAERRCLPLSNAAATARRRRRRDSRPIPRRRCSSW